VRLVITDRVPSAVATTMPDANVLPASSPAICSRASPGRHPQFARCSGKLTLKALIEIYLVRAACHALKASR
jgi:hypothetical protein